MTDLLEELIRKLESDKCRFKEIQESKKYTEANKYIARNMYNYALELLAFIKTDGRLK